MIDYKQYIDKYHGDLMQLFYRTDLFGQMVNDLSAPYRSIGIQKVVSIEARGFILGSAIAHELKAGFVAVRKSGKLKHEVVTSPEFTDYSGATKSLEIQLESVQPGDRVVIVDDWFETGKQVMATIELLQRLQADIRGISVILDETPAEIKSQLVKFGYHYLVQY